MTMTTKRKRPIKSLARGRPPTVQKPRSISRKATKTLINSLHVLEKRKAQALSRGDEAAVAAIDAEIATLGGIEKYQQASLQGQRNDRGGDSSRVLMEWLKSSLSHFETSKGDRLRMLEVGALSITNECSASGIFDMERIDLNSQSDGILQQDFMERPFPESDSGRFDIISLSLVLNFVPDAPGRGNMLLRTLDFLKERVGYRLPELQHVFPSLFLVLPAPCVTNSRYMDENHLESIMNAIGYEKARSKLTQKLVYYLWTRRAEPAIRSRTFRKIEIRPGRARNNFSIVLHGTAG